MSAIRTYQEVIKLPTFAERLDLLTLSGRVGAETFGNNRPLNQLLYHDPEWRRIRKFVISRDNGCDLAHSEFPIFDRVYVHHINPITEEDILNRSHKVFDMENLISVSFNTHQMIHYGLQANQVKTPIIRTEHDTCPWK